MESLAVSGSRFVALEGLADAELLAGTRRLVGRSNWVLAELLAHLGEVEARGVHRTRACSSLYTYCIYELRFSEDEAFRRVAAARLVRRFPVLLEALAAGELHLTGVLMLGPHLTAENVTEVLARAKHRTKRELGRLVRVLDPLPAVPARIEPLGPAPARVVPDMEGAWGNPTWDGFVQSLCPVRELAPGDRPRDWVEGANDGAGGVPIDEQEAAGDVCVPAPARVIAKSHRELAPERYKVQFMATEEYVRLVEEAKALLAHVAPRAPLEKVHLRAMRALVAELKKKKYGARAKTAAAPPEAGAEDEEHPHRRLTSTDHPRRRGIEMNHPRQRGRHIPSAVRRAVFERDGGRCTYFSEMGERCAETHLLEFHHVKAFALGGEHSAANVTLRCQAHNALAAEEDFGCEVMEKISRLGRHEAFGRSG